MDANERFFEQDTRIATLWLDHEGIGRVAFKENAVVNLESMKEYSEAVIRGCRGKKLAVLLDVRGIRYVEREARDMFAKGPPGAMTKAVAVVIRSIPQMMMTRFFLLINKPDFPMKVFRDEKKALNWVRRFN
jgi:hypothetical protein